MDTSQAAVFALVTGVARLPEWNDAIVEVLEKPERLVPGAVWKIRMHALGRSWVSRSTVLELDEASGRFRYRSQTDDDNPSYADWQWDVTPAGAGARVVVAVELHPLTFWRKYLLVHLRRPALRREMKASLTALSSAVSARRAF